MSITDATIEATRPSTRRSSGRSPEAMTALAGRIRALQRSEPQVTGDERIAALAHLNLVQLQLERLSFCTWRTDADASELHAETFALAERVNQIAQLWPRDAAPNLAMATAHRPRRHHLDAEPQAA